MQWKSATAILLAFVLGASPCLAQSPQKTSSAGSRSLLIQDESKTQSEEATKKVPAKPASTPAAPTQNKKTKDGDGMRKVERKTLVENPSENGGESYLMRYRFTPGTRVISEVVHLAKTNTKIDSTEQDSSSRTVSHKVWEFVKAEDGKMTFEYRITDIDMSQRVGNAAEIRYSSSQKEPPMPQFQAAADSIGRVISKVTIDDQGLIIARSDDTNPPNLGMGDITLPLPENAVSVGASWETPRELRIMREDGSLKPVRFRELYKLEKVSAGVATVSVRCEMITIISDPKEEAQVLQQLSEGTIKFDLDAGRMISKELEWDKRVVGFSGSGSLMEYSARLSENVTGTESFTPTARTASKPE
ncbi:hypothetical protein SH501x_000024 [Pirellulaceae bacterium SH501]